jgi:3-dehydroquinate synthase
MSASFSVTASSGSYSVAIEPGAFPHFFEHQPHGVILADALFRDACADLAQCAFFFPGAEESKSLEHLPVVIELLRHAGANRATRLIAVGGGTIQDLCAFVASIYMRGVEWVYVPTTLLGMVDSCIGGKSAINVGQYKNLVGTFHSPMRVWIDPAMAKTLPSEQQASGLIEAAKICFCRGPEYFRAYLANNPRPGMDTTALATLIALSLQAKKWFVEADEFDQKERLLLNFGHTFGHAIEGASDYKIPHGIAVGLGIFCALTFARQAFAGGGDPYAGLPEVRALEEHMDELVRVAPDISRLAAELRVDAVMERFESDKKHRQEHYVLLVVARSGRVVMENVERSPQVVSRLRDAITAVLGTYAGSSRP